MGHESLKGRVAFIDSEPGMPHAAFIQDDNAMKDLGRVERLVRQGYLVRARADIDAVEARTNDGLTPRQDAGDRRADRVDRLLQHAEPVRKRLSPRARAKGVRLQPGQCEALLTHGALQSYKILHNDRR